MEKAVENKYAFEARTFLCQSCEAEIEKGNSYYSAIQMTEEAFVRSENCVGCWEKTEHDEDSVFAFWKTLRPAPQEGPIRKRKFDIELVWSFFQNLNEDLSQPEEDLVDESLFEDEAPIEDEGDGDEELEGESEEEELDAEDELEAMGVTFEEGDQELELDEGENPDDWEEFEFEIDDEDLEDDEDEADDDDEEEDDEEDDEYEAAEEEELSSEEAVELESTEDEGPKILTRKDKSKLLFLLTLLLMRGKRLDLAKSIYKEGKEFLSLTVKGDCEDVYLVEDPQLSHEDLEEVKDSLGDLLQMQI